MYLTNDATRVSVCVCTELFFSWEFLHATETWTQSTISLYPLSKCLMTTQPYMNTTIMIWVNEKIERRWWKDRKCPSSMTDSYSNHSQFHTYIETTFIMQHYNTKSKSYMFIFSLVRWFAKHVILKSYLIWWLNIVK